MKNRMASKVETTICRGAIKIYIGASQEGYPNIYPKITYPLL